MAYSQGRNFLFCDLCGSLLNLNSNKYDQCPLCKLQRNVKEISGRQISYKVTAEDIRRDLGISIIPEEKVQLQKTDAKICEKCGHNEHTYYSRQMRSADEGATTFYVCTNYQHQFTENRYIPEIVRDYGITMYALIVDTFLTNLKIYALCSIECIFMIYQL